MQSVSIASGVRPTGRKRVTERPTVVTGSFGRGNLGRLHVRPRRSFLDRWSGEGWAHAWGNLASCFLVFTLCYGAILGGHFGQSASELVAKIDNVFRTAGFGITTITISGNDRIPEQEIVDSIDFKGGVSILAFDTKAARQRLKSQNWIANAEILRLLPSTLHVVIDERVPIAVWQKQGQYYLVDRTGAVIEKININEYKDFPLIVGQGAASSAEGILSSLSHFKPLQAKVKALVRVADRRWNIVLKNDIEVLLPEHGVKDALAELAQINEKYNLLSRRISSIDMRLTDRIAIRLPADLILQRNSTAKNGKAHQSGTGRDA